MTKSDHKASQTAIRGVLLSINKIGVLLTGPSGSGKSECALEIISHGHKLIADDMVSLSTTQNKIIGQCPAPYRNKLHLRGVGIIDVCELLGTDTTQESSSIDFVINLDPYYDSARHDPLALDPEWHVINNHKIRKCVIPASPQKNMAGIVITATKNFRHQLTTQTGASCQD